MRTTASIIVLCVIVGVALGAQVALAGHPVARGAVLFVAAAVASLLIDKRVLFGRGTRRRDEP
ncbi:hypothetical protein ES689_08115 [Frigoribacterium sp. ACAM 257]|uniref:hypothetical protein n=1 Tax=Frigoribacterium sp. ACAM 257 TaxID=2508998 RepID=UPI0011B9658B|nr:hypothetical protein [Frigoribacterium sp. ACAM 257]TWX38580.1 hypothetical protein ES689_08115 [Frigoribacterium sp. ACAM 257]